MSLAVGTRFGAWRVAIDSRQPFRASAPEKLFDTFYKPSTAKRPAGGLIREVAWDRVGVQYEAHTAAVSR